MTTTTFTLPRPYVPPAVAAARAERSDLIFIALHLPLAILLRAVPGLTWVHCLGVLAWGLRWSASPATVHRTVRAAVYLAGAEVMWRMAGGTPFYEYGKYAVALLMAALIHRFPGWRRPNGLALIYLLLLLPSIQLTVDQLGGLLAARSDISFNLSGPLALAASVLFFSGVDHDQLHLRRLLISLLAPLAGISAIAGRATLTADHIAFGGESNFVTSGGFGPNQVSAALGLGAVIGVLVASQTRDRRWRWCFLGLAGLQLVQAVITFSRGGVLNALVCIAVLAVHYLPRPRVRMMLLPALLVFGLVGVKLVLPALDRWTHGALSERYSNLNSSVRKSIAEEEIQMFRDHPALGVGPGMAKYHRTLSTRIQIAAHTEYTRLLAEHGILGAVALATLVLMVGWSYLRAPTTMTKAWVAVLAGWAMVEMSHAAMRIAVISVLIGLATIRWRAADRGAG